MDPNAAVAMLPSIVCKPSKSTCALDQREYDILERQSREYDMSTSANLNYASSWSAVTDNAYGVLCEKPAKTHNFMCTVAQRL